MFAWSTVSLSLTTASISSNRFMLPRVVHRQALQGSQVLINLAEGRDIWVEVSWFSRDDEAALARLRIQQVCDQFVHPL